MAVSDDKKSLSELNDVNRPKYLAADVDARHDHIIGAAHARMASALKIADKPASYSWRRLLGAGAISGIGFTMSIFIASLAFREDDFPAAKIAIFIASFAAAVPGVVILWRQNKAG